MQKSRTSMHFIDLAELSHRLSLSRRTLRKCMSDPVDPLTGYRIGGKLIFSLTEIAAWVNRRRIESIDVNELASELLEKE